MFICIPIYVYRYEAQMAEYKENGSYTAQNRLNSKDFNNKSTVGDVDEPEDESAGIVDDSVIEQEEGAGEEENDQ